MNSKNYYTLHPLEEALRGDFQYGDMLVTRRSLDQDAKHSKRLMAIFDSYRKAGIFPENTRLIGDYLEHTLLKRGGGGDEVAGRYLGIVLPKGDYQYVRLEGESIGVRKEKLEPPDEINILTDTCLFGASCATAVLENGEEVSLVAPKTKITSPVTGLHVSEHLCFYEKDSIARLTNLIRSMEEANSSYKKLILAMPTVEYYFYLMKAYNEGFVTKELMQEWIEIVDRQAEKLGKAISKRISLKAGICQPLDSVKDYVKNRVRKGGAVDFERVTEILTRERGLWREVLPLTGPKDWEALNYTNYVIAALEATSIKEDENKLTIYVENPSEQRILRNAAKIAKKLQKQGPHHIFRVIGIYPHEKIFIPSRDSTEKIFPRLYYLEDNRLAGRNFARAIIEANKQKAG